MEASDRPVTSESLHSANMIQDGDQPVGPPCGAEGRLDDFHRSSGSDTSRQLLLPQVCCGWPGLSIQGPLLWPLHGPSGIHQGHGSCVGHPSRHGHPDTPVSRRLVGPRLVLSGSPVGKG